REVPGDDLPDDAHRDVARELGAGELRPPRVMVEMPGDERDIEITGLADRLAVVEAFEHGEQPRVLLDGPRHSVEMPRPGMPGERGPRAQCLARRGYRGIHVRRAGLGDPCEPGRG